MTKKTNSWQKRTTRDKIHISVGTKQNRNAHINEALRANCLLVQL